MLLVLLIDWKLSFQLRQLSIFLNLQWHNDGFNSNPGTTCKLYYIKHRFLFFLPHEIWLSTGHRVWFSFCNFNSMGSFLTVYIPASALLVGGWRNQNFLTFLYLLTLSSSVLLISSRRSSVFVPSFKTGCDGRLIGSISTSYGTMGWWNVDELYKSHWSGCPNVPSEIRF